MSRRRRRKKSSGEVQINLAAMLDMAFQLLAFFILTFRPSPIEGHFQLHMPPPEAATNVVSTAPTTDEGSTPSSFVESLDIYVSGDNRGQVTSIRVNLDVVVTGALDVTQTQQFNRYLRSIFNIEAVPYDRIQLHVDPRLHYEELMKVVDICTRQALPDGSQMTQVGFTELAPAAGTE